MNKDSKKFKEVLNDTIDYFLLGDIELLRDYKEKNSLSNDLATEFTTNESGEEIVKQGTLIPMSKIVNQPYTIIFNTSKSKSEFENKKLVFKKEGYILKVENGKIMLFTWWILNNFNDASVNELIENAKKRNKPMIEIENGWYDVEILGGFTEQKTNFNNLRNQIIGNYYFEPTLEFKFTLKDKKGDFKANINESFEFVR